MSSVHHLLTPAARVSRWCTVDITAPRPMHPSMHLQPLVDRWTASFSCRRGMLSAAAAALLAAAAPHSVAAAPIPPQPSVGDCPDCIGEVSGQC